MLCHCPKTHGPDCMMWACGCQSHQSWVWLSWIQLQKAALSWACKKNVCGVSGCYFVPTWKTEFRSLRAYLSIRWNFWAFCEQLWNVRQKAQNILIRHTSWCIHLAARFSCVCNPSFLTEVGVWSFFYGCSRLWTACFFCLTRYLSNPKYPIIFLLPAWSVNYNNTLWLLLFYRSVQ